MSNTKYYCSPSFRLEMFYREFHGFGQAKFPDGGLVLGSSQFSYCPSGLQKFCFIQKWSKLAKNNRFASLI